VVFDDHNGGLNSGAGVLPGLEPKLHGGSGKRKKGAVTETFGHHTSRLRIKSGSAKVTRSQAGMFVLAEVDIWLPIVRC